MLNYSQVNVIIIENQLKTIVSDWKKVNIIEMKCLNGQKQRQGNNFML